MLYVLRADEYGCVDALINLSKGFSVYTYIPPPMCDVYGYDHPVEKGGLHLPIPICWKIRE